VIEEAPAPGMDEATRAAVCDAAVKAAKAVDYVGAGTIEFIADASEGLRADRIWFMEMNTRLQVEHPVTEEITGQDLVEWQLRVASGEELPLKQDELSINGWAIEARLYAEDPTTGFLPSTGRLSHFRVQLDYGDRMEAGVEEGDEISPFYDPMIAKLISAGEDRELAIDNLRSLCGAVEVWPVKTNAGFLVRLLESEDFREGNVETGFIARNLEALALKPEAENLGEGVRLIVPRFVRDVPHGLRGFRLNAERTVSSRFTVDGDERELPIDVETPFDFIGLVRWANDGDSIAVFERGEAYLLGPALRRAAASGHSVADGAIISPMPGKLIAVEVRQGDTVTVGQKLVTLEAMKMEHSLTAPFDGIVAELNAKEGAQVSEGALLVRIEKREGD